tara:strand:- start:664 stop:1896 length:1233 start_codon:yes stop_codon:yes gene_type:complete
MAQTGTANFPIPNDTGANFRADVNENLTDLYSTSSGSSAPPGAIDNQMWIDTSTTPDTLKIKQGSSWITLGTISTNLGLAPAANPTFSGNLNVPAGSSSALSLRVASDTDTGLFFATNTVNIHAGGTTVHEFTASASSPQVQVRGVNGTDSAPTYSFASDTNTGLYRHSADRIGITIGGTLGFEFNSSGLEIRNGDALRLNDNDNSNHVLITAPSNLTSNFTLTLPENDGDSGQTLQTNGSGTLSWGGARTPPGTILMMAGNVAPAGFHHCNGQLLSRSTYAALFAQIGTIYGSTSGSNFRVPDLRGEFVRGWDDGRGVDSGRSLGSSQGEEWKKHQHIFHGDDSSMTHFGSQGDGVNNSFIRVSDNNIDFTSAGNGNGGKFLTQSNSQGNSGGSETRPRNIAIMYVIAS